MSNRSVGWVCFFGDITITLSIHHTRPMVLAMYGLCEYYNIRKKEPALPALVTCMIGSRFYATLSHARDVVTPPFSLVPVSGFERAFT